MTALSPGLRRTGVFAPSTWRHDNDNDLDLGSTQPALLPGGMLLADGKSGTAYLVKAAHLGGVGGQVAQAEVCPAYGQAAVQGSIVYEPCEQGGLAAVDTAGNTITVRWRGPASAWGSPVLGGGAVWVTDWKTGTLYELDQATGATRDSLGLGTTLPHFSSMSMTGSHAFLGTMEGVVAVGGVYRRPIPRSSSLRMSSLALPKSWATCVESGEPCPFAPGPGRVFAIKPSAIGSTLVQQEFRFDSIDVKAPERVCAARPARRHGQRGRRRQSPLRRVDPFQAPRRRRRRATPPPPASTSPAGDLLLLRHGLAATLSAAGSPTIFDPITAAPFSNAPTSLSLSSIDIRTSPDGFYQASSVLEDELVFLTALAAADEARGRDRRRVYHPESRSIMVLRSAPPVCCTREPVRFSRLAAPPTARFGYGIERCAFDNAGLQDRVGSCSSH